VTVLVVDIRDYTVLANTIDQAALCQLIGNWFSQAECIMQRHGSSVQKYIGDAVMAVWVHQAIGQEREDAVRMLRALLEFEEATTLLTQRFGISRTLRIGAGLNTGTAALG